MKKSLAALWVILGMAGGAQGALQPAVNGQVYDDVLGISWLQDANVFNTMCNAEADIDNPVNPILVSYNTSGPTANVAVVCARDGRMDWNDAE